MAAARHLGKALFVSLAAILAAASLPHPLGASTTERVVIDRHTGLAIGGFDPVAYFVEGQAEPGKGDFEYVFSGAVWRFRNEGNRAAFVADPAVYMPRYGGYDPVGVARGVGVAGNPRLWLVVGERLYFFYSAEAREAFADSSDDILEAADTNWPSVLLTLAP
jgi:hypothetical protein